MNTLKKLSPLKPVTDGHGSELEKCREDINASQPETLTSMTKSLVLCVAASREQVHQIVDRLKAAKCADADISALFSIQTGNSKGVAELMAILQDAGAQDIVATSKAAPKDGAASNHLWPDGTRIAVPVEILKTDRNERLGDDRQIKLRDSSRCRPGIGD